MDKILIRFPFVGQDIFKKVDDKTLANCKNVSKVWNNFLDNGSFLWKRRIWKFTQNQVEFNNHWELVTNKVPIDMLKNLAIAVEEYFTLYPKELDDQFSPLRIAGSMGIISLCDHIIERTGVINPARKKDGLTPLHTAAGEGNLEFIRYIAEQLEDKNSARNDGATPLLIAAQNGHLEIVKYIAGHLENKNPAMNDGWTPLHFAAQNGHLEIVKYIAGNLDNKNPSAENGDTPLSLAQNAGQFEVANFLNMVIPK